MAENNEGGPPPIDEHTIDILNDVKTAMSDIASFGKQMAEAIATSNKSMEQMSELAKTINKQNGESVKSERERVGIRQDEARVVKELQSAVNDLAAASDRTEEQDRQLEQLREMLTVEEDIFRTKQGTAKYDAEASKRTREHNEALSAQKSLMVQLGEAASTYYDKQVLNSKMLRSMGATGSTASHIFTGKSSGMEGLSNIAGGIMSIIPMLGPVGGLIGFMLAGKMKEAEFTAVGHQAAQQFDQISGYSREFASKLGSSARELSARAMAGKDDLKAVAMAFSQTGVSAYEASEKISGFKSIVGNDLMLASLAADKALELPAGKFAELSGTLAGTFNTSAKSAFEHLVGISGAAKDAGLNAAVFMQQVMDASGALRLLNANYEAVGQMQLKVAKQMKDQGFNAAYAGQYAAAGAQQATQGISGMGVGLSAVIGERMGFGNGLDAWYAMKSGGKEATDMRGGKLDPGAIAAEMAKLAKDTGKTRAEQVYFLSQMGFGVQGAETILDVGAKAEKGQLTAKDLKELNRAMGSEADKTNAMERHLDTIKNTLSHIATGLLGAIIATLSQLYHGVMYLGEKWINRDPSKAEMHNKMMDRAGVAATKSYDKMAEHAAKLGPEVGDIVSDLGLDQIFGVDPELKKRQQRAAKFSRAAELENRFKNANFDMPATHRSQMLIEDLANRYGLDAKQQDKLADRIITSRSGGIKFNIILKQVSDEADKMYGHN